MVVTEEGLPLSYEVFEGNRADVTTLEDILNSVERKHGKLGRVWVFDRGIVSEENLNLLRSRGASYLVATPKRLLTQFQKDLCYNEASKSTTYVNYELETAKDELVSRERQESLLAEYDRSGMSGVRFAQYLGIKYTTLAHWLRSWRRYRQRQELFMKAGADTEPDRSNRR